MAKDIKEYDEIMRDITAGLTGDPKKDISFLQDRMEQYKDHELGKEILRACGRLMYNLLPDDKKDKLEEMMDKHSLGTEAVLDEVRFNIYKKEYDRAFQLITPLIDKLEKLNMFQDDQVSEYHTFNDLFEEILYSFYMKPQKQIRRADIPYSEIYLLYGSLLIDMKRVRDAKNALEKALQWNPINTRIRFEYGETLKMTGDIERFFNYTLETFKYAYRPGDIGRCFRNLGYYFVEKKLYSEAMGCYLVSAHFEKESPNLQSELYYIHSITEGKVEEPSVEEMKAYSDMYGFPMGPYPQTFHIAYDIGKDLYDQKQFGPARYLLQIAYDLLQDEEIEKMLQKMSE